VLPSSQYEDAKFSILINPSPQISVHILALVESPKVQFAFTSTWQVEFQPSSSTLFPSSQYPFLGSTTIPSPHLSDHTLAVV